MADKSIRERWQDETNMSTDQLMDLQESRRNELYLERASGNESGDKPLPGGPLEDAIAISKAVDGDRAFDEDVKAEAEEALNFFARTKPQFDQSEGEPLLEDEDPRIHKGEISLMRWGFDPDPDDEFP
jgi:hypothetical protein